MKKKPWVVENYHYVLSFILLNLMGVWIAVWLAQDSLAQHGYLTYTVQSEYREQDGLYHLKALNYEFYSGRQYSISDTHKPVDYVVLTRFPFEFNGTPAVPTTEIQQLLSSGPGGPLTHIYQGSGWSLFFVENLEEPERNRIVDVSLTSTDTFQVQRYGDPWSLTVWFCVIAWSIAVLIVCVFCNVLLYVGLVGAGTKRR